MTTAAQVLERLVREIDERGLGAYGAHVLVGDDGAQHRWRSDDRVNLYSVSKGVCALAAGIAVDEGLLRLDTPVSAVLPDLEFGAGVDTVTLEHLLTMTSGIDFEWFGDQRVPWPDLAQEMLRRPSRGAGRMFQYSDVSTYVAMRMLAAVAGDVRDWLLPRLFDPLDIHNPQWHRCPLGYIVGGSGLEMRTEELARIARVLRDRGAWQGRQLIASDYVDRMHSDWVVTGEPEPYARYGFAVWGGPDSTWRLDGRYGQYVVVDPDRDAVITITAHVEQHDAVLAQLAVEALAG